MNCYYQPNTPAIGVCKSCGRGLSIEYATDVGNGLACKDKCEDRVRLLNSIIDRNTTILAVSNTQLRRNMIFSVTVGLLFCVLGVNMGFANSGLPGGVYVALGIVFILRGIFSYTRSAQYPNPDK